MTIHVVLPLTFHSFAGCMYSLTPGQWCDPPYTNAVIVLEVLPT